MKERIKKPGNPNPSPATRFKKGDISNPRGKTSEHRRAEMKAGEIAAQIQMRMLQALDEAIAADPDRALSAIAADPLRLIKDAMDREFGTAVQKAEVKGGFTVTIRGDDAEL